MRDCPDDIKPVLQAAIDAGEIIPWHRARPFQDLTLQLLLQHLLTSEAARLKNRRDVLFIPTVLTRQPLQLSPATVAGGDARFHLFISPHNPGAAGIANAMARESELICQQHSARAVQLTVTDVVDEMHAAQHFLILLNKETHTRGEATEQLCQDIRRALAAGVHLLLVHETRPEHRRCTFKEIIDSTTAADLCIRPGGMYDELAVEMCGGEHARISLRLLLDGLSLSSRPSLSQSGSRSFAGQLSQCLSAFVVKRMRLSKRDDPKRPDPNRRFLQRV